MNDDKIQLLSRIGMSCGEGCGCVRKLGEIITDEQYAVLSSLSDEQYSLIRTIMVTKALRNGGLGAALDELPSRARTWTTSPTA